MAKLYILTMFLEHLLVGLIVISLFFVKAVGGFSLSFFLQFIRKLNVKNPDKLNLGTATQTANFL